MLAAMVAGEPLIRWTSFAGLARTEVVRASDHLVALPGETDAIAVGREHLKHLAFMPVRPIPKTHD